MASLRASRVRPKAGAGTGSDRRAQPHTPQPLSKLLSSTNDSQIRITSMFVYTQRASKMALETLML